eukprot:470935_1
MSPLLILCFIIKTILFNIGNSQYYCTSSYASACRNIDCPDNQDCTISCSANNACRASEINCPTNAQCHITCTGQYSCYQATINAPTNTLLNVSCTGSDSACRESHITGSTGTHMNINCANSYACENAIIDGRYAYKLQLPDCATSSFTCWPITVYCPPMVNGEKRCIIGGDASFGGEQGEVMCHIYAINSWNDIEWRQPNKNDDYYCTMHCTPDYSKTCVVPTNGPWQCSNSNSVCADYITPQPTPLTQNPTTNQPTLIPTQNPITNQPTYNPTKYPTINPTNNPTIYPTNNPVTSHPTFAPITPNPTIVTISPTDTPTYKPTISPTFNPITHNPTSTPTDKEDGSVNDHIITTHIIDSDDNDNLLAGGNNNSSLMFLIMISIGVCICLCIGIFFIYNRKRKREIERGKNIGAMFANKSNSGINTLDSPTGTMSVNMNGVSNINTEPIVTHMVEVKSMSSIQNSMLMNNDDGIMDDIIHVTGITPGNNNVLGHENEVEMTNFNVSTEGGLDNEILNNDTDEGTATDDDDNVQMEIDNVLVTAGGDYGDNVLPVPAPSEQQMYGNDVNDDNDLEVLDDIEHRYETVGK